jgi:N-acetylglucosaminyldiphosphoundecaprenol N-acetyl-beta-D-mannosaminyltransferase
MPSLEISGVNIKKLSYEELISEIKNAILGRKKLNISYANANTVNLAAGKSNFRNQLNSFDIIHPDGVGILIASKLLYGENKFPSRFNGSDFYPLLAEECIKNKWRIFFFGHHSSILENIKLAHPGLNVCGTAEGYSFHPVKIVSVINNAKPDILIVGLGQPLQEELILFYKNDFKCMVTIAVGDGIKVFAGEKKRGPEFMQKAGLEWIIRLFYNPFKYFRRYVIGNPLFLYRIIMHKLAKFSNKP